MWTYSMLLLLIVVGVSGQCSDPSFVDDYGSLPPAPVFPSAILDAGSTPTPTTDRPLVEGHYSEKARLFDYRPPVHTPSANDFQSGCPHMQAGLVNWHDPAVWGGSLPAHGEDVTLPAGTKVLVSSCSIAPDTVFGKITVPSDSELILGDATISIEATGFDVAGTLAAGSESCRLRNKVTITLHGSRSAQPLPADPTVKGIYVTGTIDLHGARFTMTWSRLAMTARPGDDWIFIQDLVNWQVGQTIVITTTELKDTREWHRNEERVITDVRLTTLGDRVTAIQVDSPLLYEHFGGEEYQAEVALLSRNILIQGDSENSDPTDPATQCTDDDGSTYQCENTYLTGFGAHVQVYGETAIGRFAGVELYRAGQTNQLGRYPLHFHLMGNLTEAGRAYTTAYVKDSSVHRAYYRCYTIHGTSGVLLTENTAYDTNGHCYFLEDGVEELNVMSYNQAAFVHPMGPYMYSALGLNKNFQSSTLNWVMEDPDTLLLPSDVAAGCFYVTNSYNDVYGNAASGGWTGFSLPSLAKPVKLHEHVDIAPVNRPFWHPFRGNSAHSTAFWIGAAGGIYVGGELKHDTPGGLLTYNAGRGLNRDTCADPLVGTSTGKNGCWDRENQLWMRFEDNKVFLANRGVQDWGLRAEFIRHEFRNVGLSMNVLGQIYIDDMLNECRSRHLPEWMNGCPGAGAMTNDPPSNICNIRDTLFWSEFGGFQWYDVSQNHIVENVEFRNCNDEWEHCIYGPSPGVCADTAVFTSLTHSNQFAPELMQVSSGVTFTNCGKKRRYSTATTDANGVTLAGRLQNWYDADGSTTGFGKRSMLGSSWGPSSWWAYNAGCVDEDEAWMCEMATGDSAASVLVIHDVDQQSDVGKGICGNGGPPKPCPEVGKVYHFGASADSEALPLVANAKITGPIIAARGGWYLRLSGDTPKVLTFERIQVAPEYPLVFAIPYPADTTFTIQYVASRQECNTATEDCTHTYTRVYSVDDVVNGAGDTYYWDNTEQMLYLRLVQTEETFGPIGTEAPWTTVPPMPASFTRGGQTLMYFGKVVVEVTASCDPCAYQAGVTIPAALATTGANCNTPVIDHSGDISACAGTASGSSCTLTCQAGYTKTGDLTCTDGLWNSPSCDADACDAAPVVANAEQASLTACAGTSSGLSCTLQCEAGHVKSGNLECTTGSWNAPTCTPAPCLDAPMAENGGDMSSCQGASSGSTCPVVCLDGFSSDEDPVCTLGVWSTVTCTSDATTTSSSSTTTTTSSSTTSSTGGTSSTTGGSGDTCPSEAAFDAAGTEIGTWPETATGATATLTCPSGSTGTVRRRCVVSGWQSPTGTCSSSSAGALEQDSNAEDGGDDGGASAVMVPVAIGLSACCLVSVGAVAAVAMFLKKGKETASAGKGLVEDGVEL